MFSQIIRKYAKEFQVILLDFPGHGKSDRLTEFEIDFWFYNSKVANGIGKVLLEYSIKEQKVTKVDVNEDNEQAVGFYEKFGFKTYDRSELDASGKPYPTLHMKLEEKENTKC
jgi:putative acetyltransferase